MKKIAVGKSKIIGKGIIALESIKKGDRISYIRGPKIVIRDFSKVSPDIQHVTSYNWIGVGRYTWIDTKDSIFKFINHSCNPNAAIVGERTLVALENIDKAEEIFMDYSLTEAGQDWSIGPCKCGSKNCRVNVGPINSLSRKKYNSYLPFVTKRFQSVYKNLTKRTA